MYDAHITTIVQWCVACANVNFSLSTCSTNRVKCMQCIKYIALSRWLWICVWYSDSIKTDFFFSKAIIFLLLLLLLYGNGRALTSKYRKWIEQIFVDAVFRSKLTEFSMNHKKRQESSSYRKSNDSQRTNKRKKKWNVAFVCVTAFTNIRWTFFWIFRLDVSSLCEILTIFTDMRKCNFGTIKIFFG